MSTTETASDRFRRWARTMLAHRSGAGDVQHSADRAREVYQSSTMGALLDGVYDGDVTIAELLTHGDFGLGTFNHLDGEMVILDGTCYHLRSDGSASLAAGTDLTPFAAVTWFTTDTTIPVPSGTSRAEVIALIDEAIPSKNLIYGIRVTGTFSTIKTRTVMEQRPPYPPLTQATAGQAESEFSGVAGTLAGFRTHEYEQGISVPGYHLQFLDEARTRGGHSLDFRVEQGEIAISAASEFHLSLPRSGSSSTRTCRRPTSWIRSTKQKATEDQAVCRQRWPLGGSRVSTFVLIPGAWHAGWAWRPVARRLRDAGHQALALTMPGLADGDDPTGLRLQAAVDHVVAEVERRDLADVVLVAHSWGGYPLTGAAHSLAERLSKVVYYSAFVPARGRSALDELPPEFAATVRTAIRSSSDWTWAPTFEIVQRALMQGEPEQLQRFLFETLVPQPGNYHLDALDVPEVTSLGVPVAYVLSADDHGLGRPDAAADFIGRLGVEPIVVPGPHESLLTNPEGVTHGLLRD